MLHVPAREVPAPTGISAEAKAILTAPPRQFFGYSSIDDIEAWRRNARGANQAITGPMEACAALVETKRMDRGVAGVTVYDIRSCRVSEDDHRMVLDIHRGNASRIS